MALIDDLTATKASLDALDVLTTTIATDVTAIQAKIANLLSQIPAAATLQAATDLATQAALELAKLTPLTAALTTAGQ